MILDVGCGDHPRGDVNTDLYRDTWEVGSQDYETRTLVDLLADGEHLPFRTSSFEEVLSYHTIEHTRDPVKFLTELIRVSKRRAYVVCPDILSEHARKRYHRHILNGSWFHSVLKNFVHFINVGASPLFIPPRRLGISLPIGRPYELHVDIWKNGAR